ncbi:MAG TPA: signal peptidase II, partial [Rhabdochlamydiaceae bacterium]|nr:signal peptidase II [Rhabdochlamydiaceae bacterium]
MKWRESLKLFALAAAILITDFVSKGLINFYMSPAVHTSSFFPFGGVVVFQDFLGIDFCIHHVTNRGAAWGIGEAFQNGLIFIRAAIILGLFIYMRFSAKAYTY